MSRYNAHRAAWTAAALSILFYSVPSIAAPPVEAFGSLPKAEFGRLSPDGKHLALIRAIDGKEKVAFLDLTKPDAAPMIIGMQDALAGDVIWKNNKLAICVFHTNLANKWDKKDLNTWSRAIGVDVDAKTQAILMYNAPYLKLNHDVGSIVDMDVDDPDHVYMNELALFDHDFLLQLYQVNVATGIGTPIFHGNNDTIEFLTNGHGGVLGQIDQDGDLTDHVFLGGTEVFKYQVKGGSAFGIEGLVAGDHPQFAVGHASSFGTSGLYNWLPSGFGAPLFENPTYDIDGTISDERTGRIIGITFMDDLSRAVYFDPAVQNIQSTLEKAFPGQSLTILSKDDSGAQYLIETQGPKNPPVLSLYTAANHQVQIVEEAYDGLKPSDLGDVKPYPYKARDGLDIHAYLTLPPGRDPHNLPTVIFPHGGPEARDSMDFDWWAQFMASRGYAVLQPNFRGSSGYGWNFVQAGDGEWAGKVQYDVQDGVKKLIADGITDPKRICIVGASYGGYMALAGATFSPDLYACAISYAGVSDLNRTVSTGTMFGSEVVSIWKRRIGADKDASKLDSGSPANYAGQVKIPILLLHSDKDNTVPIEQSQIEEDALKHAGKQVEFVTLEGDDHQLEYSATRIKLLQEVERFLAAHIGDPAPKPAS
jgi:dienelactone hydrolase